MDLALDVGWTTIARHLFAPTVTRLVSSHLIASTHTAARTPEPDPSPQKIHVVLAPLPRPLHYSLVTVSGVQFKVGILTAGGLAPCLSSAVGYLIEKYEALDPTIEIIAYKSGYRGQVGVCVCCV